MFQETHSNKESNSIWKNQWGTKCYFANGTSQSGGVAILFSKKVSKVNEIVRDINGRYIMCKVLINNDWYGFVNIYAPNRDTPEFFSDVFQQISTLNCDYMVIGGDFNLGS